MFSVMGDASGRFKGFQSQIQPNCSSILKLWSTVILTLFDNIIHSKFAEPTSQIVQKLKNKTHLQKQYPERDYQDLEFCIKGQ